MHIITGFGRSGTSFIAEIIHNCGFYMGEYNEKVNAGYEFPVVAAINKSILSGDYWGESNQVEYLKGMSNQIKVVKDPRFMVTLGIWVKAQANIESVIFVTRNYNEIIKSSEKSTAGLMAIFNGWNKEDRKKIMSLMNKGVIRLCKENKIKVSFISFPECLENFDKIQCLTEIIKNKEELKKQWSQAIRKETDTTGKE